MIHIANIKKEQAEAFWALRLEALRTHPEAFGASYEDSVHTPLSEVETRIHDEEGNYILGACTQDGELVGIAGFRREQATKASHKGSIWGVYVSPAYRGQRIANHLIQEVLDRGEGMQGLKQINLSVVTTNQAALKLYKKLGFETYGVEKNALEYQGQGYDNELLQIKVERDHGMEVRINLLDSVENAPMDLLLLADPSEELIRAYLNKGQCYIALHEEQIVGVFVLVRTDADTIEIVNIAVHEDYQGRGIGKKLVLSAIDLAREQCVTTMEIGTGNSSVDQLMLYQKCGFRLAGIDRDFFTRHYPEKIYENGIQCRDMIRLSLDL